MSCAVAKAAYNRVRKDPRSLGQWLTLAEELVLGEWLAEIIPPCRQIGVRVRFDILVDIRRRRKVRRIAPNVNFTFGLIDADIVDSHCGWERQLGKIYKAKRWRYPQVKKEVHWFLGYRSSADLDLCIGTHATAQ